MSYYLDKLTISTRAGPKSRTLHFNRAHQHHGVFVNRLLGEWYTPLITDSSYALR